MEEPDKYNIILTSNGADMDLNFPPATKGQVTNFNYIIPVDKSCVEKVVNSREEYYKILRPVIGRFTSVKLIFNTIQKTSISLHNVAILAYIKYDVIDPRMDNKIATEWGIYTDNRIFLNESSTISLITNNTDRQMAEILKNRILKKSIKQG